MRKRARLPSGRWSEAAGQPRFDGPHCRLTPASWTDSAGHSPSLLGMLVRSGTFWNSSHGANHLKSPGLPTPAFILSFIYALTHSTTNKTLLREVVCKCCSWHPCDPRKDLRGRWSQLLGSLSQCLLTANPRTNRPGLFCQSSQGQVPCVALVWEP